MHAKATTSIVAVLAVLALASVAGTAAASPQPTAEIGVVQAQANETASGTGEQIDSDLALVSSAYNDGSGTVTLTFQSDGATAVTLSDAGGFVDGGTINRRTVIVDGRTSVEFAVTETQRGFVGVSIATDDVLYGEVIRSPTISPFRGSSGTVGWFGGVGIVLVSFLGAALWKLYKEGGEPVEATP